MYANRQSQTRPLQSSSSPVGKTGEFFPTEGPEKLLFAAGA